jgi:hypothetical protein
VLRQTVGFINQQFIRLREHIFFADDLSKFLEQLVIYLKLLLARDHDLRKNDFYCDG